MSKNLSDWLLFFVLSIIWGSSFILIRIGLDNHLSAYQVAAIRIVAAGIVLLPVGIRTARFIPRNKLPLVCMSGTLGSLLPSFLFCLAEEEITSSLAGTLNCLTPVFVVLTGALFFKTTTSSDKVTGMAIALAGSFLLMMSHGEKQESRHYAYVLLVVLATFLYGYNVNMVTKYLLKIKPFHLTAFALVINAIPALGVLIYTGYFNLSFSDKGFLIGTAAASLMGLMGTALATVIFYILVKRAGGIFASMVTYGIPFVAIGWGVYYGESFSYMQLGCLLIILYGVYKVNRRKLTNVQLPTPSISGDTIKKPPHI